MEIPSLQRYAKALSYILALQFGRGERATVLEPAARILSSNGEQGLSNHVLKASRVLAPARQ